MPPAGAWIRGLLLWLGGASVPAAFAGALLLSRLPSQQPVDTLVRPLIGLTLALSAVAMLVRTYVLGSRPTEQAPLSLSLDGALRIRPAATIALGAVAGLLVGLTSIGSGSIVAAGRLLLYPRLPIARLVGTDVAHAIPMVAVATVGHLLLGRVHLPLTASLIVGGVPGVLVGAHISSRIPGEALRGALAVLLVATSLTLLRASTPVSAGLTAATAAITLAPAVLRRGGRPASREAERRGA